MMPSNQDLTVTFVLVAAAAATISSGVTLVLLWLGQHVSVTVVLR